MKKEKGVFRTPSMVGGAADGAGILVEPHMTTTGPKSKKRWGLRSKAWLEVDGSPFMGEGRLAMLEAIHRCGSMIRAADDTGIPYRRIRGAIREMESVIGRPLVKAHRGGSDGGGAALTPEAHELIEVFHRFADDLQKEADALFHKLISKSSFF